MKTTLDIADPLLREAEQVAARDGTTLQALVEQGLRQVVADRAQPEKHEPSIVPFLGNGSTTGFKLRDASVGGNGLTDKFKNATPDQWLEAMYGEPGLDRD